MGDNRQVQLEALRCHSTLIFKIGAEIILIHCSQIKPDLGNMVRVHYVRVEDQDLPTEPKVDVFLVSVSGVAAMGKTAAAADYRGVWWYGIVG